MIPSSSGMRCGRRTRTHARRVTRREQIEPDQESQAESCIAHDSDLALGVKAVSKHLELLEGSSRFTRANTPSLRNFRKSDRNIAE